MKEKIAVRIEEVKAWGELVERLGFMEDSVQQEMEGYKDRLKETYPNGGEAMKEDWAFREVQGCKAKLAAYESIRATILKAMG